MSKNSSPLVSILIVTLRGGENLKKCLLSVKKNNYKHYELVVVNNGGGIKIDQEVRGIYPRAKFVNLKENTGFAVGNNIGYKYCQGKYILFLNDDTIVTPDLIRFLVEFGESYPKIAVIQPKTIFTRGILQAGADYLTFTGFLFHYGFGKNPNNSMYNIPLYMYSANGNCVLIRKKIIEDIGLFDQDFFTYFEETDFCHRVWLSGNQVAYLPKAVVYHKGAETSRYLHRSILFYHPHKNRLCAHLKNLSFPYLMKIVPILFLLNLLLFFYYLIKRQPFAAYYVLKSLGWNILNLPATLGKRRYIQNQIRKVNDDTFIRLISYTPRLSYYLRLANSNYLGLYKDDSIVKYKAVKPEKNGILKGVKTVLIATFSPWIKGQRMPTNGSVEPIINYFSPKIKRLVLIDQPYPMSDFLSPRIEIYEKGKIKKISALSSWIYYLLFPFLKLANTAGTHIAFKIRDFLSIVDWCIRDRTRFDYFIGVESINTLAGIVMRKFGFIDKVIYYVSDYSPQRYPNKIFNWLYVLLDRYCAIHTDYIWDVSKAIQPARIQAGLDPKKSAPVIHVPNALNTEQIKYNSTREIKPYSLVYMGTLGPENGPDIVIQSLPEVLKKYPKTRLHIIGGGEKDRERLEMLVSGLKIEKEVEFYGYIPDGLAMSKIMRECYIGLSSYRAIPGSARYYGDAGKIRAYAAAGLPIITTNIPPLGREVVEKKAAIITKDNPHDFALAIKRIFSDRKLYKRLRNNAIKFAKDNTWENSFKNAFLSMETN